MHFWSQKQFTQQLRDVFFFFFFKEEELWSEPPVLFQQKTLFSSNMSDITELGDNSHGYYAVLTAKNANSLTLSYWTSLLQKKKSRFALKYISLKHFLSQTLDTLRYVCTDKSPPVTDSTGLVFLLFFF